MFYDSKVNNITYRDYVASGANTMCCKSSNMQKFKTEFTSMTNLYKLTHLRKYNIVFMQIKSSDKE